jgi:hypothetical protein
LRICLWSHAQDHDGNNLIARLALIVLNRRQDLPDDPVPVVADVDGIATFPLTLQGIAKIGCDLQVVKKAAGALDFPVGLEVATFKIPQIVAGFRG